MRKNLQDIDIVIIKWTHRKNSGAIEFIKGGYPFNPFE